MWKKKQIRLLFLASACVVACLFLYFVDPRHCSLFPCCPFRLLTGCACPGCGSMRAIHECLHGDFLGAFVLNPLMFGLLPFIPLYLWCDGQTDRGRPLRLRHPIIGWTVCGLVILFWVLRNLLPLDISLRG